MTCRVCGREPEPFLDLGRHPLANGFGQTKRYPLGLAWCECQLVQLTHVVPPDLLYRDYPYRSGENPAWHRHLDQLVTRIGPRARGRRQVVVEIASNDGTLLRKLDAARGLVIGVEPAANLTRDYGTIPVYNGYWDRKAVRYVQTRYGPADTIVAQNVVGHVDDIHGFLGNVAACLKPGGSAIFEMPHALHMAHNNDWPQVYHEHLSYWTMLALDAACFRHEMFVSDVEEFPALHGGTMRYWVQHMRYWEASPKARALAAEERRTLASGIQFWKDWADKVHRSVDEILYSLEYQGVRKRTVWGYGASAKASTLLSVLRWSPEKIVDDSPAKHGKVLPGSTAEIVPPQDLGHVDVIAVLAWNWKQGIMDRARSLGFKGCFFVPFPQVKWIDP